jgi:hypothetical protein
MQFADAGAIDRDGIGRTHHPYGVESDSRTRRENQEGMGGARLRWVSQTMGFKTGGVCTNTGPINPVGTAVLAVISGTDTCLYGFEMRHTTQSLCPES